MQPISLQRRAPRAGSSMGLRPPRPASSTDRWEPLRQGLRGATIVAGTTIAALAPSLPDFSYDHAWWRWQLGDDLFAKTRGQDWVCAGLVTVSAAWIAVVATRRRRRLAGISSPSARALVLEQNHSILRHRVYLGVMVGSQVMSLALRWCGLVQLDANREAYDNLRSDEEISMMTSEFEAARTVADFATYSSTWYAQPAIYDIHPVYNTLIHKLSFAPTAVVAAVCWLPGLKQAFDGARRIFGASPELEEADQDDSGTLPPVYSRCRPPAAVVASSPWVDSFDGQVKQMVAETAEVLAASLSELRLYPPDAKGQPAAEKELLDLMKGVADYAEADRKVLAASRPQQCSIVRLKAGLTYIENRTARFPNRALAQKGILPFLQHLVDVWENLDSKKSSL